VEAVGALGFNFGGFFFTGVLFEVAGLAGFTAGFVAETVVSFGCVFVSEGSFASGLNLGADFSAALAMPCFWTAGTGFAAGDGLLEAAADNFFGPCFGSFGGLELAAPLPTTGS